MKTYKKPVVKVIELSSENIMDVVAGSLGSGQMSSTGIETAEDIGVASYRKKLWSED